MQVEMSFETDAQQRFVMVDGVAVPLADGAGVVEVEEGDHLLIFGIFGTPGMEGTLTLTAVEPAEIVIHGHPIEMRIAQGRTRTGGNRFFIVRSAS